MGNAIQQVVSVAIPIVANIVAPGIGGMIGSAFVTGMNGGDIGDVAKGIAMNYAGQYAGQAIGSQFNSGPDYSGGYDYGADYGDYGSSIGDYSPSWEDMAGQIPIDEGGPGIGEISRSQGFSPTQNFRYDTQGNIEANPNNPTGNGNIERGDLAGRSGSVDVMGNQGVMDQLKNSSIGKLVADNKNGINNVVNVGKGIYGLVQANKQAGMAEDLYNAQLKQMQQSNAFASYRPEAIAQLRQIQANPQAYLDSPEVVAMRNAGLEAARRQGAAGGNLASGKGAIDLQDWGQKFAFETLQNKQNQLAQMGGVNDYGSAQYSATTQSGLMNLASQRQKADYAGGDLVGTGMNIVNTMFSDEEKKKKQQQSGSTL